MVSIWTWLQCGTRQAYRGGPCKCRCARLVWGRRRPLLQRASKGYREEEGKAEKKATKMKEKKKLVKTDDAGVSFQLLNLRVAPFMVCLWYDI